MRIGEVTVDCFCTVTFSSVPASELDSSSAVSEVCRNNNCCWWAWACLSSTSSFGYRVDEGGRGTGVSSVTTVDRGRTTTLGHSAINGVHGCLKKYEFIQVSPKYC